jgi:hypothetical protein
VVDGHTLRLTLVDRKAVPDRSDREWFRELFNKGITGDTEDGWSFEAQSAGVTQWSIGGADGARLRLEGWNWVMRNVPETETSVWVSDLDWDPPHSPGNLFLSAETPTSGSFSRGHWFLRGPAYDYLLLSRHDDRWLLVVQERSKKMSLPELMRDLNALAYAFGTPFAVGGFYAVSANLDVIGMMGGLFPPRPRHVVHMEAPVPSTNDLSALSAVLFERLADFVGKKTSAEVAKLTLATWYYLECLGEYSMESRLTKMMLSTIAVARFLLDDDLALVSESKDWKDWLCDQSDALAGWERPGRPGALRGQLSTAAEADANRIIELAARKVGLLLLPEIADAVAAGAASLRAQLTSARESESHLARLRVLSSAFIAKAIGYSGRLSGWSHAGKYAFYDDAPSTWWTADDAVVAQQHVAAFSTQVVEVSSMWPQVLLPEIPEDGPVAMLARFASGLAGKTGGRVYADVHPLPRERAESLPSYAFSVHPTRRPSARIVLFLIRTEVEGVSIDGWPDQPRLSSSADVIAFLKTVGDSETTKMAIERSLLVAMESERDGTR